MRAENLKDSYLERLYKGFYQAQNKKIHTARAQLGMSLDECRELAKEINGKPSISSLDLEQRWQLIEALNRRGARIFNPKIPRELSKINGAKAVQDNSEPVMEAGKLFPIHLEYWNKRFPKDRRGFPSNRQLALIETLWELYFDDHRPGRGLRGFIFRQTRSLPDGPVSSIEFLKNHHVEAVLMPLVRKGRSMGNLKRKGVVTFKKIAKNDESPAKNLGG